MTSKDVHEPSLIQKYQANAAQALVDDHSWRFHLGIKVKSVPSPDVYNILESEWRLSWSLGHIPWYGWRSAIQSVLFFELKKLNPDLTRNLYQILDESLAVTAVDPRKATEGNKSQYLDAIKGACSEDVLKSSIEWVEQGLSNYLPFIDQTCKSTVINIRNWNIEFIFSVFTDIFKTLVKILIKNGRKDFIDFFGRLLSKIIFMNDWPIPPFYLGDTIEADLDYGKLSNVIFNFWRWQYTQRNSDYRKLLSQLAPLCDLCAQLEVNLYDLDEYFILRTNGLKATEPGIISSLIQEGNELTRLSLNRFGYLPTWPTRGQTADQMLSRMISGEFTYWERFFPRAIVDDETLETSCGRVSSRCDNPGREMVFVNDGHQTISKCSQQCLMRHLNLEFEIQNQAIRTERSRIQRAGISRMVGLLMYDLIEQFKMSQGEAIKIIVDRHFPDDNQGWNHLAAMDAKEGEQWFDYKERLVHPVKAYL